MSAMRRSSFLWCVLVPLLVASAIESTAATLPPLSSSPTNESQAAKALPPAVPHQGWYFVHREAINDELVAIRSLRDELTATAEPHVLTLICIQGIELDHDTYLAAYTGA